jgi:hypothetical protein
MHETLDYSFFNDFTRKLPVAGASWKFLELGTGNLHQQFPISGEDRTKPLNYLILTIYPEASSC